MTGFREAKIDSGDEEESEAEHSENRLGSGAQASGARPSPGTEKGEAECGVDCVARLKVAGGDSSQEDLSRDDERESDGSGHLMTRDRGQFRCR
jgi:hypothetical protein